ncbi:MAG: multicomponent Na+:H+ antiporter subunit C [Gammaproteobacteria bacterium]|jgi:multicomponent Na+:H+ antiporter subunit C
MTPLTPYWLCAAALFSLGFASLLLHRELLRKVLAMCVMVNGIFVFMVALAARTPQPDPLPHALVLTGIVVSVSATALALVVVRHLHKNWGISDLDSEE